MVNDLLKACPTCYREFPRLPQSLQAPGPTKGALPSASRHQEEGASRRTIVDRHHHCPNRKAFFSTFELALLAAQRATLIRLVAASIALVEWVGPSPCPVLLTQLHGLPRAHIMWPHLYTRVWWHHPSGALSRLHLLVRDKQ